MKRHSKGLWLTDTLFVILTISSFTALLIPVGRITPKLMGTPYTVWMGVVFCILYIVLAYFASTLLKEGPNDN
ncbi:MAG: hypothetical protein DHS20C17_05930 [Cyclobacteriaceae bacterium]|nr:MAG: hypothetical protein DHS20C17_05930 [Cyclobacteriaceae bacterium]